MIYLDNNATSPVDPEVSDAVLSSLRRDLGNPSSSHLAGRKVREVIGYARQSAAALLDCSPAEIFFTSGGTESNNLAILGVARFHGKGHIITSSIEHPSVAYPCLHLRSAGFDVSVIPVDSSGMVNPEDIRHSLRPDTILISIMHANNETGVLQPIGEIASIANERRVPLHVDAAQTIGKAHFNLSDGVDMITLACHKFYGPKGIGCLRIRKGTELLPILYGAGHEQGMRPGTENVGGIVGLGKACEIAKRDIRLRVSHTSHLRDMLLSGLKEALPDIGLNGHRMQRLPNTLNLRVPGILSSELVDLLRDQVAFSTGSACHEGKPAPSAVLKNMGLSDEEALSSVRLSVGKDNTEEEIRKAIDLIAAAVVQLRKSRRSDVHGLLQKA